MAQRPPLSRAERRGQPAASARPASRPAAAPVTRAQRVRAVDVLRGFALLAMVVYHFCFDLAYWRLAAFDFYRDPWWLHARTAILSGFLLLAGISLVLAERTVDGRARFWRHVVRIAGCAAAVSVASYLVFPQSYIWFGVLHAIAVSLVLVRPVAQSPRLALIAGLIVIVAGTMFQAPWFDHRALGWLGLVTAKPRTEDYVPLFPWTGVLLVGITVGHVLVRTHFRSIGFAANGPRLLAWMGRHSLAIYMVHQPLLLGLLYLLVRR
jgi:uncharacterized membrane protein